MLRPNAISSFVRRASRQINNLKQGAYHPGNQMKPQTGHYKLNGPNVIQHRKIYTVTTELVNQHIDPCPHYSIKGEYKVDLPSQDLPKLTFNSKDIIEAVDFCWNPSNTETNYQPKYFELAPFNLPEDEQAIIDQVSSLTMLGNDLMHQQKLSIQLRMVDANKFYKIIYNSIYDYLNTTDKDLKMKKAQALHDGFIALGWLEKYWLFQGFKYRNKTNYIIPMAIAKPYKLLAAFFGNQPEFLYYVHYVGASCENMAEMSKRMETVDFNDSKSIVDWVKSFNALYDFQSIHDQSLTEKEFKEVLQSERYFRFIHLAMEMVYSRHIDEIKALFNKALNSSGDIKEALIKDALKLMRLVETQMNQIFITLPQGSKPEHYNKHVRWPIAGTFGKNCGTVFHHSGKFLEGCGNESHINPITGLLHKGKWGKYIGQTGAQTSVRVIMDMMESINTNANDEPLANQLLEGLMKDDQVKIQDFVKRFKGNPLTLQLMFFRGICRPPSHNFQATLGRQLSHQIIEEIHKSQLLLENYIQLQIASLNFRAKHFNYVNMYINKFPSPTAQKKATATGGTETYDFLPNSFYEASDSIAANIRKCSDKKIQAEFHKQLAPLKRQTNHLLKVTKNLKIDEETHPN